MLNFHLNNSFILSKYTIFMSPLILKIARLRNSFYRLEIMMSQN